MSSGSESSDEEYYQAPAPKVAPAGPGFKLGALPQAAGSSVLRKEDESLLGNDVVIVFSLPDGTTREEVFKMGQNVELLKLTLEKNMGIEYHRLELYLEGQLMADPLSLNDIPLVKPAEKNTVVVKVK
eukprot:TRINITY_DN278_c0_g1_i2.p1 TRINITY_DN278_c0_g1~~TRINITY_DN278_c0_g1_i2.p1  ORF type:complete len:145 (+),score=70.94 TRINITY_DN278_c0_g1_i2:54-437(+)